MRCMKYLFKKKMYEVFFFDIYKRKENIVNTTTTKTKITNIKTSISKSYVNFFLPNKSN